jgi:hypothetical protein
MIKSRVDYKTKGGDNAHVSHVYPEGVMSVEGWMEVDGVRKSCFWSKSGAYFGIEGHKNSLVIEDKD